MTSHVPSVHDVAVHAHLTICLPPKHSIQFVGGFGSLTQISISLHLIYIYLYHASEMKREEGAGSFQCSYPDEGGKADHQQEAAACHFTTGTPMLF